MRINTNVSAMNAYSNLARTQSSVNSSMQKLSSGFRINRAADDAAGLGIANQVRASVRSATQASRNAEQANSLLQIAEGATNSIQKILERMKELATQAGSDTVDSAGRTQINNEFTALKDEIDRIANTTKFQGQTLLKSGTSVTGTGTNAALSTNYDNVTVNGSAKVTGVSAGAALVADETYTLTDNGSGVITLAETAVGSASYTGTINADRTVTFHNVAADSGTTDVTIQLGSDYSSAAAATRLGGESFTTNATSVIDSATLTSTYTQVSKDVFASADFSHGQLAAASYRLKDDGTGNVYLLNTSGSQIFDSNGAAISGRVENGSVTVGGVKFTLGADYNSSNSALRFDGSAKSQFDVTAVSSGTTGAKDFLIGSSGDYTTANTGDFITLSAMDLSSGSTGLNLGGVDLTTASGARTALGTFDSAIDTVNSKLGAIGAFQNRIEYAMDNLKTSIQNLTAAESVIRDVDMASEMVSFSKNQILAQAGTAMLAQANQSSQGILQLLRG